jgi:putative membrane protein
MGGGSITGRHVGAELMYYGGTTIDLALAVIVMTHWYQATGRELARTRRRQQSGVAGHSRSSPVR